MLFERLRALARELIRPAAAHRIAVTLGYTETQVKDVLKHVDDNETEAIALMEMALQLNVSVYELLELRLPTRDIWRVLEFAREKSIL